MGKYEEALERARQGKPMDEVFPELKDEWIRKALITIVKRAFSKYGVKCNGDEIGEEDLLAYLEKQKEHHYTKRNNLFDKCVENCDSATMKEVSDNVDAILQKEQKSAEWSESDEDMCKKAIEYITSYSDEYGDYNEIEKVLNWLKSLRPHWKPNEEQLTELRHAISGCSYDVEPLVEIEEQLKKLM